MEGGDDTEFWSHEKCVSPRKPVQVDRRMLLPFVVTGIAYERKEIREANEMMEPLEDRSLFSVPAVVVILPPTPPGSPPAVQTGLMAEWNDVERCCKEQFSRTKPHVN